MEYQVCFISIYHSDTIFINGLPVSSLFCYTTLLYLHQCLPTHFALHFLFFFLLFSLHHVHSMHHSSSLYFSCCTLPPSTRLNHSQQHLHLFSALHIYTICAPSLSSMHSASACSSTFHGSVHRVVHCHTTFSLLHSLKHQHTLSILHVVLVSIPLPDNHGNSSSFLVVMPMHSSSPGVMLRFLSLSSSRDSSYSLS
jgi:hypothetical protein